MFGNLGAGEIVILLVVVLLVFGAKWKASSSSETVAFGSALHGWGFTLSMAQKKGVKFTDIVDVYEKGKHATLAKLLPLHDAILDMTTRNCPWPIEAQEYRVPKIWKGNMNSEIGKAMLCCNGDGPTAMCVTNTQIDSKTGIVATARLFSGSAKKGDQIYLQLHAISEIMDVIRKERERGSDLKKINQIVNEKTSGNKPSLNPTVAQEKMERSATVSSGRPPAKAIPNGR